MYVSLRLNKGTYNKWLIPSNNNDNDGRRERADSCVFLPKKYSLRKPELLQRRMFKLLSKKEEKKRDQPSFAEGGVFTYENESIIAI